MKKSMPYLLLTGSQDSRENVEAQGQERKASSPVGESSRKCSGSRNQLWKITAGLLYEAPLDLAALGVMKLLGP